MNRRLVKVGGESHPALFGGKRLAVIAGPCVLESLDVSRRVVGEMRDVCARLNLPFVFKASYAKANRSAVESYRGPGLEEGLDMLAAIRAEFGVPVLTDVHEPGEAGTVGAVLIEAAGRTGRVVNIKKGQFLAPGDMERAAEKASSAGASGVLLTERGTTFGYGDLVVDMRSFAIMAQSGWPTVFDITHSLQQPGGRTTGGRREFALPLARAAVAAGADAVFLETHPDPANALSDAATMLTLAAAGQILESLVRVREALLSGETWL
ncbi:MAG: 2-dehydro-3-deoxyphosphooctonate aldolase (KDO 8-P synthase) [bacterium]|nr:MAG: 2-dehydro-3-deoxyphosphooctonate aldolase (KDO 8-P synthase) [bacterium]